jgi:histone H3/H4
MTALVNAGVPVVLVTTPQFLKNQKAMEARTCWTSEQFTGRIGHYEKLPDSLSEADLANVARSVLPEGDAKSIELLVEYAQSSAKYLAGIDAVVCRSRFLAARAHRKEVTRADVKQAIQQAVIPSDSALAQALAEPQAKGRGKRFNGPLTAPQGPISAPEESDAPTISKPILADRNERGVLDIRSLLRAPQAEPEPVTV